MKPPLILWSAAAVLAMSLTSAMHSFTTPATKTIIHQTPAKPMYLIRDVFKAKPGKAKEIVRIFKEAGPLAEKQGFGKMQVMTDFIADYWTVVIQYEVDNMDAFAKASRSFTSQPEIAPIFKGYLEYVDSGKREVYLLE